MTDNNAKKLISVVIPTYNEEANVEDIAKAVAEQLGKFPQYGYEILFIDNDSKDTTRDKIRAMCAEDHRIKAIFNAKNYGQFNSPYYGMLQARGDCIITMVADFQEPPDILIPQYIKGWKEGYKIVLCQKTSSKEKRSVYAARKRYYKFMKKHSKVEFLEQVNGSGLYDREFLNVMKEIDEPRPFLRGIVAEMGYRIKLVPFEQPLRQAGRSSNGFWTYYDGAMQSLTAYTKSGIRVAVFIGLGAMITSVAAITVTGTYKILNWNSFDCNNLLMWLILTLMMSANMFFIGIVGEYVLDVNSHVKKRPLVVEAERINFD